MSEVTGAPLEWPTGLYELDGLRGMTVCVEHRGAHVWYLGGCVAVGGGRVPLIGPFRPCVLHAGRHLYVRGHCINPGRRYAYRYGRCPEDGCAVEICNRLDVVSGRTERLDAETDRPHAHAAPVRVELDEERLAAAIVAASQALRDQRRPSPSQPTPAPAADRPRQAAATEPPAPASGASIPTVAVWSPGPDDGPGT
jgi:hypothetical protein